MGKCSQPMASPACVRQQLALADRYMPPLFPADGTSENERSFWEPSLYLKLSQRSWENPRNKKGTLTQMKTKHKRRHLLWLTALYDGCYCGMSLHVLMHGMHTPISAYTLEISLPCVCIKTCTNTVRCHCVLLKIHIQISLVPRYTIWASERINLI